MTIQKYKILKAPLLRVIVVLGLFFTLSFSILDTGHTAAVLLDPTSDSGSSSSATDQACTQQNNCTKDAASDPAMQCAQHQNDKCDLFKKYLNPTINLLSALVGLVVVGSVIIGAIQYSASEGDPQKAAKAKSRIMNSVIALVAFIFLFAFLQWLIPGGILNK